MDERIAKIEEEKQKALQESNNTYQGLLQDNQNLLDQQNAYAEQYEQSQNEALDKQLAFNEQKIEQQKEAARQNKETEEKKAKNDYFSYINPYGVQAESFASQGLLNSGVSETAKLGSYNTYQNRLANANKVMQDAFVQYDNDINEARLNNDVQKAQNALARLQMQLQYSENYYNQKSAITQNQLQNNQNLNSEYYGRYSDEYNRYMEEQAREEAIRQWEKEFAESQRQYNEQMEYKKQQDALAQKNWEKEYALSKKNSSNIGLTDNQNNTSSLNNSSNLNNTTSKYYGTAQNGRLILANPYTGEVNPDAQYGVFESESGAGYQPNNINGKKLSKSGMKVKDMLGTGVKAANGNSVDEQNVWTLNSRYYIWDGSINDYVDITDLLNSKMKSQVSKTSNSSKTSTKNAFEAKIEPYAKLERK